MPKKIGFLKKESEEQVTERLNTLISQDEAFDNLVMALNSSKKDLLEVNKRSLELDQREQEVIRRESSIEETVRKKIIDELVIKDKILLEKEYQIENINLVKDNLLNFYNLAIKELPREIKIQINKTLKEIQENPNWEKERTKKQGLSR